ncbi:hypothetical protein [Vreelandella populi]|uniref:hypothetical protein n=1 Tax=Vreelandella populi TaxID=2498858 RepID=UPI000F8CE790|nr:hypothetical protein [Halomonas populi]RUR38510.1 hypothetical protein ELY25_09100 [Halomonas populi]
MKISERLHQRLINELGLQIEPPVRIRRGKHGISAGTWAWKADYKEGCGMGEIGSEDTMQDCVKARQLKTYTECRPLGYLIVCAEN